MTVHNLNENLTWLLGQHHQIHYQLQHTELPVEPSWPAVDDGQQAPENMARLQIAPQSTNRPQLLVQQLNSIGLPTPSPSRSPARTSASRPNVSLPVTPLFGSSARRESPPLPTSVQRVPDTDVIDIDDIESEDGTSLLVNNLNTSTFGDWGTPKCLWNADAANYASTESMKKGKKRKSGEHESGLNKARTSHRKKRRSDMSPSPQFDADDLDDSIFQAAAHSDSFVDSKPAALIKKSPGGSSDVDFQNFLAEEDVSTQRPSKLEQETEQSSSALFRTADETVPDSDGEEDLLGSPEKGKQPSQLIDEFPKGSSVRVHRDEAQPNLPLRPSQPLYESAANCLPIPSWDTPSQNRVVCPTPSIAGGTLSLVDKAIVKNFMKVDLKRVEDLITRLEKASRAANAEYTQYMCEEGQVSDKLKERKKMASERLKASRKVLDARRALAKTVSEREAKKNELDQRLNDGEDEDSEDEHNIPKALGNAILNLKPIVDQQEAELFHYLKLSGLSEHSSNALPESPGRPSTSCTPGMNGVLVASTQKPRCSSPTKSRRSPSRAINPSSQHIVQTPMPQTFHDFGVRSPCDTLADSFHAKDAGRYERSSRRTAQSSMPFAANYTANMGSPPSFGFEDENFLNEEDDADMLDAAAAFEQIATGSDADRPVLGEISSNIRRPTIVADASTLVTHPDAAQKRLHWTDDVFKALRKRFHLQGFRHNQLEAINATLAGEDAFVLMPTGGGKSLCYQLPSIVTSGQTSGVTIVISPLLSLMQDQVDHLMRLKIQALLFNGEISAEHKRSILQSLQGPHPERFAQLLYITPEMMSKSTVLLNALQTLHRRQKLARIVIDEAHCVSQWGHDFRPDYKELGKIRRQFSGVPVMALTATATENVKLDVMHNLGMENSKVFTQSFNRPNLSYTILKKDRSILTNIAESINRSHRGRSGIIYCLSRKNCEAVAKKLREEHGINAAHYHAGMDPPDRIAVQKKWQSNEFHVIVATIAFGMGIDKPDVRFVIHHTIPKSLEGYYQETGRAGRDGKPSSCYLYYGFGDTTQLRRMIDDGDGDYEQKERQKMMLRNVVMFCENRSDCRRMQVLNYFNEHFSAADCGDTCDNCSSNSTFEQRDLSQHARNAVALVQQLGNAKVTMGHCIDIYRGSGGKKMTDTGHDDLDQFGLGKDLEREDVDRLFYRLVFEEAIEEYQHKNRMGFPTQYVKLGRRSREFLGGRATLTMQCRISPNSKARAKATTKATSKAKKKKPQTGVAAAADDYPASTNVSSPLQARAAPRDNHRRPLVDSESESDEDFAPVRKAGVIRPSRKKAIGPPITMDQKLASLDEVHLHVLEDFVEKGRKVVQTILISQSLRKKTVSDTMLRQMAVDFPSTEAEMIEIEGMNADLFSYYGSALLQLVQLAQADYQAMMAAQDDEDYEGQATRKSLVEISDDSELDDFINDDDDDPRDSDGDVDANESSRFFGASDPVATFNRHISQMRTYANPSTSAGIATTKASEPYKPSAGKSAYKKKGGTRSFGKGKASGSGPTRKKKTSAGSRTSIGKASSGSITGFTRKNSSGSGSRGGGSRSGHRGGGGGGGGMSSIGMMPT